MCFKDSGPFLSFLYLSAQAQHFVFPIMDVCENVAPRARCPPPSAALWVVTRMDVCAETAAQQLHDNSVSMFRRPGQQCSDEHMDVRAEAGAQQLHDRSVTFFRRPVQSRTRCSMPNLAATFTQFHGWEGLLM